MLKFFKSAELPTPTQALKGRDTPRLVSDRHFVLNSTLMPPWPDGFCCALFGMGCFWGAERLFWKLDGVYSTQVGFAAGLTRNPTYEEVCSGQTGHNEVVRLVFDPDRMSYEQLLQAFWEGHDPTQSMRQGNDVGTQYRSGIYTYDSTQKAQAIVMRDAYQQKLTKQGFGTIVTEIIPATEFYYAENYHQQYLGKNPNGYCGLGGTNVSCALPSENVRA